MEYLVAVDGNSPIGVFYLASRNKIGGASGWMEQGQTTHPVIVVKDLDWSMLPAFVRMTHIRNPGADDPVERELVLPSSTILAVVPKEPSTDQGARPQQSPGAPLH